MKMIRMRFLMAALLALGGFFASPLHFIGGGFGVPMLAEAASKDLAQRQMEQVDVNKGGAEELMRLKGVGQKTAENIISYRQEHGPFKSVEELVNVKGIGGKKLEGIRENIKL